MTDTQLTIIVTGLAPTLTAIGAIIAVIINGMKSKERYAKNAHAIDKVHTIVNDRTTVQTAKIDKLEERVIQLTELLAERKQEAALLAQRAVSVAAPSALSVSAAPAEPVEVKIVNPKEEPVPTEAVKAKPK